MRNAALFLDFDGTLVELAETPDAIHVPADLEPLLARLNRRLGGRLALVSGRAIEDLERHLACPAIAVSGSHGTELRAAGGRAGPAPALAGLSDIQAEAERFARAWNLLLENKPAGLALHFRQAPQHADRARAFMAMLAGRTGLALQHGKMVVELRPAGADKGEALRAFMKEPDFADARPLFVGDDLTDEHAFRAAAALGGAGILVGSERETAALWRLPGVAAVMAWLAEGAEE